MAVINTDNVKIGAKRETTFGTAVAVTGGTYLYARNLTVNASRVSYYPEDVGFSGIRTAQTFFEETVDVSMTFDFAFGQGFNLFVASVLGDEAAAVETTVSQGDYAHTMDVLALPTQNFFTLAFLVETDRLVEIVSFRPTSVRIESDVPRVGTVTVTGTAYKVNFTGGAGVVNVVANITGLTPAVYQSAVLGGLNHYFRMNADGGAGLTSGENKAIRNFSFGVTRQMDTLFSLRGADSFFTEEPMYLGDVVVDLSVGFATNDDAVFDFLTAWKSGTTYKGELFLDGAQIGSGVNTSYKLQFPLLQTDGSFPEGFSLPGKNQRMLGGISFQALKRSAAPTGMTGVTGPVRYISIDRRTTKWLV